MDQKIVDNVKRIAFNVLHDERINTEENFDMSHADKMDSVNRVSILVAIEEEYDFVFRLKEIASWNTVMELAEIIEKHLA